MNVDWRAVEAEERRIQQLFDDIGINTSEMLLPPGRVAAAIRSAFNEGAREEALRAELRKVTAERAKAIKTMRLVAGTLRLGAFTREENADELDLVAKQLEQMRAAEGDGR